MRSFWDVLKHTIDVPDDEDQWKRDAGIVKCRLVRESEKWYGDEDIHVAAYPDPMLKDCIGLEVSNSKWMVFYRVHETDRVHPLGSLKRCDVKTRRGGGRWVKSFSRS
jgi:hypothetical protein